MRLSFVSAITLLATLSTANAQTSDTVFVEVGSSVIDGSVFKPHAARVRVYRGDSLTAEWVNELVLGDSAGRKVMRWVTTGVRVPLNPNSRQEIACRIHRAKRSSTYLNQPFET